MVPKQLCSIGGKLAFTTCALHATQAIVTPLVRCDQLLGDGTLRPLARTNKDSPNDGPLSEEAAAQAAKGELGGPIRKLFWNQNGISVNSASKSGNQQVGKRSNRGFKNV